MLIDRRTMMAGSAALIAGPALAKTGAVKPGWYDKAIIIDGLGSISDPYSPDEQLRLSDRGWQESKATGTTAINLTIGPVGNQADIWEAFLKQLDSFNSFVNANPERMRIVRKASDIRATKNGGQLGLIYGTQDSSMVGSNLDRLAEMNKRGIRVVQLTYNLRNLSGDGSLEPDNAGLSKLGRATIARIEAEKMLLDLAHGGAKTIAEAIAAAKGPLTISHTGCRNLHDNPRNVWDTELKAVADKGGVVGIYFMPFLAANSKPTGEQLIQHIEHAAKVCGEDHVAIGTDGSQLPLAINDDTWRKAKETWDFRSKNGFAAPGEGPDVLTIVMDYNRLDRFQRLADALSRRGWSQVRIEKLLGLNLMRLYAEVWGGGT